MVRTLRRKFVLIAMGALTLILILLIGTLNLTNSIRIRKNADDLLRILSENDGDFPGQNPEGPPGDMTPPPDGFPTDGMPAPGNQPSAAPGGDNPPGGLGSDPFSGRPLFRDNALFGFSRTAETPFETRWFWVRLDGDLHVEQTDTSHVATVNEDTAASLATRVLQAGNTMEQIRKSGFVSGSTENYRYRIDAAENTFTAIFLDRQNEFHNARLLLAVSIIVSLIVLLLMLLLTALLSGRAVAPIAEAFEKQKRFISDASHELKTPLSVISADVDVLEMTTEKSEWTSSIRDQIARMNQLIQDMLSLSRMEDGQIKVTFSDVDLSDVVRRASAPFSVVADSNGLTYQTDIADNLHLQGDAAALEQLVTILSDNAIKYAAPNSTIRLRLGEDNRHLCLEIANACDCLPEGNLDRLFDRFYRADESRSKKTGGFGIGLSVARAITESHGGHIRAEREGDRTIRFIAGFPLQQKKGK